MGSETPTICSRSIKDLEQLTVMIEQLSVKECSGCCSLDPLWFNYGSAHQDGCLSFFSAKVDRFLEKALFELGWNSVIDVEKKLVLRFNVRN